MNWTDGYVADAEYTSHYFAELAPPHLDLAALSASIQPPDRERGRFRYCELGCGNGMSTNLLAACYPNAEFVGIDFMPVHIANSRRLAKQAGLKNVEFLELSFADACKREFQEFDYIVAHGVYSWITPTNRLEMVEFFRRFLAPGGLVYVSYNTLPGWHAKAPLQKIVSEYGRSLRGASTKRAKAGFDFAIRLAELNCAGFSQPDALQQVTKAANQAPNYLAQEYLNDAWHPMYVTDVMREMSAAKLDYVASATLAENEIRFIVTDEQAALIKEQPTPELRELVKDLCINASFRRDVYTRGGRRLSPQDDRQQLLRQRFALIKLPPDVVYLADYPGRQLSFDTPIAHKIVESLAEGPLSVAELTERLGAEMSNAMPTVLGICLILCISKQALPVDKHTELPLEMNRLLSERAFEDASCNALATPYGAGIGVSQIELALLGDRQRLASVELGVQYLMRTASARGRSYSQVGKPLQTEEETRAFLTQEVTAMHAQRLPIFRQLGLLPEARAQ